MSIKLRLPVCLKHPAVPWEATFGSWMQVKLTKWLPHLSWRWTKGPKHSRVSTGACLLPRSGWQAAPLPASPVLLLDCKAITEIRLWTEREHACLSEWLLSRWSGAAALGLRYFHLNCIHFSRGLWHVTAHPWALLVVTVCAWLGVEDGLKGSFHPELAHRNLGRENVNSCMFPSTTVTQTVGVRHTGNKCWQKFSSNVPLNYCRRRRSCLKPVCLVFQLTSLKEYSNPPWHWTKGAEIPPELVASQIIW